MDQSRHHDPKAPRGKDPAEEALVELFDERLEEAETGDLTRKSLIPADPDAVAEEDRHPDPLRPADRPESGKKRPRNIL